jgi:uncharacterized membrane protein (Fun14 family)
MIEETITNLLMGPIGFLGGGAMMGWMFGYAVKKFFKIAAFVVGGILALLMYLNYVGIIGKIDYNKINHLIVDGTQNAIHVITQMVGQVHLNTDHVMVMGLVGFTGGVLLGLKSG